MTLQLAVALAVLGVACAPLRYHRDRNAPGLVDVAEPPANLEPGKTVLPGDPGERMVTFNPGVFGGGGYAFGRDAGERGIFPLGVELTLNRGEHARSHNRDDFFVYPFEGTGVSLGWEAIELGGDELETGPIYLEVQRFEAFFGMAGGIAFDPGDVDVGVQGSAWYGPYFARARYLADGGFEIVSGLQIKVPLVWVWSR